MERNYVGVETTWALTHAERPWLLNSERSGGVRGVGGHYQRAKLVKAWREVFAGLCLEHRIPALQWVTVEVIQTCRDKRLPDVGNCFPAAKAAIDGIVDAGVVPDDSPPFVRTLTFQAPVAGGLDALTLLVTGPACSAAERMERRRQERGRLVRQVTR